MTPDLKAARGTKRTCQNDDCGLHFYDLNRDTIVCPNCHSAYVAPVVVPLAVAAQPYRRSFNRSTPSPQAVHADAAGDNAAEAEETEEAENAEGTTEVILEIDDDDETLDVDIDETMSDKQDD
jgi:uncharacterized protein (TIGR02300 family)